MDRVVREMVRDIDPAWNDIGQPVADEMRRYLKHTYPLRDRRSHKVIRFHNVNSGWYDIPCLAYPWGYSNIKQNCPTVDKSILDYITRVISTHIQIDQQTEDVYGYSDGGNPQQSTVTEQYIAARQSPIFCQYLQEWKDPEGIGPIQIPSRTTVSEAVKLLLLAEICENTSDDAPDILASDIERILSDQQRLNEIEDCPLWELLVKPNQHSVPSLHPDSHSGKNAFYTIGLHGDYRFGGIHSFVIDPEYRQAFLAKEAETGIDAQTIMKCIGKDWSEKPYRRCGQKIEAFSNLLSLLDGNERVRIQQDQLEAATLDILRQEEIVTKIYSGDYILSKGVDIGIIKGKIVDLKSGREGEHDKWFQSSISLQQTSGMEMPQFKPAQAITRGATATIEGNGFEEGEGEPVDRSEEYISSAISTLKCNIPLIEKIRRKGAPWYGIQVELCNALPDSIDKKERTKIAYANVPRAMNEIFGRKKWSTEKRPKATDPKKTTTWVVVKGG